MRSTSRLADERTRALDLNDIAGDDGFLFVRDGVGVAGRGVAARLPFDEAPGLLAAIEHTDETGAGVTPLGIGWIPFRPGEPGEVVVPRVAMVKSATGACWVTTVDPGDGTIEAVGAGSGAALLDAAAAPPPAADGYRIEQVTATDVYLAAVESARGAVRQGRLTKAVIAREIAVTSSRPFDRHGVLRRLKASFGSSYRYAIDGLIGASPELLVAVDGRAVSSYPLAGTAPRVGDVERDAAIAAELVESTKDQVEHRVVIDMIHDTLLPWCSYLDWEPQPSIVAVANVQHLGTRIEGRLSSPPPGVSTLVRALSPTPALGGDPGPEALKLIAEVEGVERDRYGGAVGWLDAGGNGTFAVTIRCAQLSADGTVARLHAGGGIVADSDPLAELAETQAKFQAMLSALIRP